tara:strand:- start:7393 stop:8625 length:1233 start_codon:yes stop_codon:yes gene_type:complete
MSSIIEDKEVNSDYIPNYSIANWEDTKLDLKDKLLRAIYAHGFEKPSSIQQKAVYPMTKSLYKSKYGTRSRDIIAQAQSGTGKTGAFTVSTLQLVDETKDTIQALILAPTHELARQINSVIISLSIYLKINTVCAVGGIPVDVNKKDINEKKPQIIVGTPGRVHDIIKRKILKTEDIKLMVLDEADEMLSSGFKEQMYKIFSYMPNKMQIGLFSATMPQELHELTNAFMKTPTKIIVKSEDLTLQGIAQYYINLDDDNQKYECIKDLFSGLSVSQAIIYCNSVSRVDDLTEAMKADEFPVEKIHGQMDGSLRKKIYNDFKHGSCRVLITSDLFARGIDVQQVSIVINFDIPRNEHTYLHRIGRSGRWGRKGIAINFQTRHDHNRLQKFQDYYQTIIKEMPSDFTNHLTNI